jgi:hypothetical protein
MPVRASTNWALGIGHKLLLMVHAYAQGDLSAWVKQKFETEVLQYLENKLSEIEAWRVGGEPARAAFLIERDAIAGTWPGILNDQQWSERYGIGLRSYQRGKQQYLARFGG